MIVDDQYRLLERRDYNLLITLFLLFICFPGIGQQQIVIKNALNEHPVEGAVINFYKLNDNKQSLIISGEDGKAIPPYSPPFVFSVQHLSYEQYSDTVVNHGPITVYLFEKSKVLKNVVITGQFEPQSAKNSVFNITTLESNRIKAQAPVSLQDVLSNVLNVKFSRDNATGVAGISLQGISGQNVKVLIDGIPVAGRSGVNNEIDLNQINIDNVQRIELVQGPMAVNYGSDALAGVINIITKKDIASELNVELSVHEETIGSEYKFFDEGIHSPAIQIGYKPHKNWYSQLSARINRFGGWQGDHEGRDKAWYPKTQHFFDGLLRYERDKKNSLFYKFSYLDELLENLGIANRNNPLKDPFAIDETYNTKRIIHQIQSTWAINHTLLNTVISYTDYVRYTRQFVQNLVTGDEKVTTPNEQDTTLYRSFFFRSTVSNLLKRSWLDTQIGVETTLETAGGNTLSEGLKHLTDLAIFISAEAKIGDKLKIRPGVRASYNSVFSTIPVPSANIKYDFSDDTQLRIGYGRGFRAPSIRELYHQFIDSNHNIRGNENLQPEYSHNLTSDLVHDFSRLPIRLSISGFFNYINNRITLFTTTNANQITTYTNLHKYKSTGSVLQIVYDAADLQVSTGFSYTGRYQMLNEDFAGDVPEFIFSPEINLNLQYRWEKTGINFNAFYKYIGATKNYQLPVSGSTGESSPVLAKASAYQLLDTNMSKDWGRFLSVSAGVRNLLDVTNINNTSNNTSHGEGGVTSIAYGRSYFLKINFHFNK